VENIAMSTLAPHKFGKSLLIITNRATLCICSPYIELAVEL